jgi:hypothetical protein
MHDLATAQQGFHLMARPIGPLCNLAMLERLGYCECIPPIVVRVAPGSVVVCGVCCMVSR